MTASEREEEGIIQFHSYPVYVEVSQIATWRFVIFRDK